MATTRTAATVAGALALALASVVLVAAPAQAAAYRYWTYWQAPAGAMSWTFATQGPGTSVPADGSVEGWAFGLTTESADPRVAPATAPDFAGVCNGTAAQADRKRVALVIDTGPAQVAPDGQTPPAPIVTCVVAPTDATGYQVLRSVADVRTEDGLVCGVAGYPTGECAPVLDGAEAASLLEAAASAQPSAGPSAPTAVTGMPGPGDAVSGGAGSPVATIVVGVLLIGGAAYLFRRQRSTR